jgi:hypothetical protein
MKNDVINIEIPGLNTKKEGYFKNMSNNEYHSTDGISSTLLEDLELSVSIFEHREHFKHHRPVYDMGNFIHDALAFPTTFKDMYLECETVGLDTIKANKQREENPNKTIVNKGAFDVIDEIRLKVQLVYGQYMKLGAKECSFIFTDEDTGLVTKIRPDLHLLQHGIVLDYKSTKEINHKGFERTIEPYNYHRSAAWYIDNINKAIKKFNLPFKEVTQFGWICIPKTAPYKPFGFMVSEELIEKGREDYQRLINKLLEVRRTGKDELFKVAHSWEFRKQMNGV